MHGFFLSVAKYLLLSLISELLKPKVEPARMAAGGLKDISFPTVDATRPIPWLYGTRMVDNSNLFATFDFKGVERTKSVGEFPFKTKVPLPPFYYISAAMTLCGGSGVRLREVWVGDKMAWKGNAGSGSLIPIDVKIVDDGQKDAPRGVKGVIEFYSGSDTPSPYIESKRGVGNTPTWKHLTYAVLRGYGPNPTGEATIPSLPIATPPAPSGPFDSIFNNEFLDALSNAFFKEASNYGAWLGTSKNVEHIRFVLERMPDALSTGLGEHPDGDFWEVAGDANPVYALAEILVNKQYGAGIDPAMLDAAAFHAAAATLHTEGHGTSNIWDNQRVSGEVAIEILRQIGALLRHDWDSGLLTIKLLRETEAEVLVLDDSNVRRVLSYNRASADEATNALTLQYTAASEDWKPKPVEAQDLAAIDAAGLIITGTASYAGVTNAHLAQILALRDLRALSAPLSSIRLEAILVGGRRYAPGDPVLVSAPDLGVNALRMRVISAKYPRPGEPLCELELLEDVFYAGAALYSTPAGIGYGNRTDLEPEIIEEEEPIVDPTPEPRPPRGHIVFAPYALTRDATQQHGLIYALPEAGDDTATEAFSVRWYGSDPEVVTVPEREYIGLSAEAISLTAINTITEIEQLTVSVDPASAAVLRRFGADKEVPVRLGPWNAYEMLVASSVVVNEAGTEAVLHSVKRGCWGTVPLHFTAGISTLLLCDHLIDAAPLSSYADQTLNATIVGVNSRGVSSSATASYYRYAMLGGAPVFAPGNLRINGVLGAPTNTGAIPAISIEGNKFLVSTGFRGSDVPNPLDWFSGGLVPSGFKVGVNMRNIYDYNDTSSRYAQINAGQSTVEVTIPSDPYHRPLGLAIQLSTTGPDGTVYHDPEWHFHLNRT